MPKKQVDKNHQIIYNYPKPQLIILPVVYSITISINSADRKLSFYKWE